jgi:hypothetical protein
MCYDDRRIEGLLMLHLRRLCALFVAFGCGGATVAGSPDGGTASGTGGSAGSGGSGGGGPCTAGTTSFHLSDDKGNNEMWCVGMNCSASWMTISSLSGVPMPIEQPCETMCGDCMAIGCPAICVQPRTMAFGGERLTWDGTFWEASTCGAGTACRQKACAAPGRYTVKMCVSRRGADLACEPSADPFCGPIDFDYPSSTPVEMMIAVN